MGAFAPIGVLSDTASAVQSFIWVFVSIYILLIFIWVLLSWVQLPYSRTFSAVQEFIDDVVSPYIRVFRGRIPALGPIDVSPIVAVVVLILAANLVNALIGALL
jgi:YggT family protein